MLSKKNIQLSEKDINEIIGNYSENNIKYSEHIKEHINKKTARTYSENIQNNKSKTGSEVCPFIYVGHLLTNEGHTLVPVPTSSTRWPTARCPPPSPHLASSARGGEPHGRRSRDGGCIRVVPLLYLPLYLHCIQTWAGYIVSQCIHRHRPLYLTSRLSF